MEKVLFPSEGIAESEEMAMRNEWWRDGGVDDWDPDDLTPERKAIIDLKLRIGRNKYDAIFYSVALTLISIAIGIYISISLSPVGVPGAYWTLAGDLLIIGLNFGGGKLLWNWKIMPEDSMINNEISRRQYEKSGPHNKVRHMR